MNRCALWTLAVCGTLALGQARGQQFMPSKEAPPPDFPMPVLPVVGIAAPAAAKPTPAPAEPVDPKLAAQVEKLVTERLKAEDAKRKKQEEEKKEEEKNQGYQIGSKLNGWVPNWRGGLWFDSPNKDFTLHIGGAVQYDFGFYSPQSNLVDGPRSIGTVSDGANLRRGRLRAEGTMWENTDFRFEMEFFNAITPAGTMPNGVSRFGEQQTVMTTGPTDAWFTIKQLPYVGNFRIGNQKEPIGLEHLESFRFLPFMERSQLFDFNTATAFNNGFSPGALLFDTAFDERATWALGAFKNSYNVGGFAVDDGDFAVTGRLTWLPMYEQNGAYLTHLGIAGSHRDTEFNQNRFRIRPSVRSSPGPLSAQVPVLTDTGFFQTNSTDILGLEYFTNIGPLTLQAEYMAFWNSDCSTAALGNVGTVFYQGYYVQALYWLTGEYTQWNKREAAPTRYVVNNPFFLLPGTGCHGTGAWQVAARWSQVDSNNRGINGGMLDDFTLGLNWILNPNVKIQWNYELARRYGLGAENDGNFNAFGMRAQFDF